MQRGKPPVLRRGRISRFRADRGEPRRIERTLKGAAERSNRTLAGAAERWRGQRSGAVLQLTVLPWSLLEVPSEPPVLQALPVEEDSAVRDPATMTAVPIPSLAHLEAGGGKKNSTMVGLLMTSLSDHRWRLLIPTPIFRSKSYQPCQHGKILGQT